MNKVIRQIYESRFVQDADGNNIDAFPVGLTEESGDILFNLIKNNNLHYTLEVGMAFGLSTLFICEAHKVCGRGHHIAIDPNEDRWFKSIGRLNIQRADLENFLTLYVEPSYSVLPRLLDADERFDLAFIDGRHNFDYAMVDFFYVDLLLKNGGFVVIDDMWLPQIRKLVSYILQNRAYRAVSVPGHKSLLNRYLRFKRRFMQNPLELDYRFKLSPHNIFVMQKMDVDTRKTTFHRSF